MCSLADWGRPGPAPSGDLGGRTWNVNFLPSGIAHHWNISGTEIEYNKPSSAHHKNYAA